MEGNQMKKQKNVEEVGNKFCLVNKLLRDKNNVSI